MTALLDLAARAVDKVTGAAPIQARIDSQPAVALTFDDGPDPHFTPLLLDALAELSAVATFFCVGDRARAHPALVRRIADEGHQVGSHGFAHAPAGALGPVSLLRDYRRGRQAVEDVLDREVRLFRPPQGATGMIGATVMHAAGLHPWLWSCDTEDWRPGVSAEGIAATVRDVTAGEVILLHDGCIGPNGGSDRTATVVAIPAIVDRVRANGLALTTLPSGRG